MKQELLYKPKNGLLEITASEYELEMSVDVDIYTNACVDTHIYAREDLDEEIIKEIENLFNMSVETLNC